MSEFFFFFFLFGAEARLQPSVGVEARKLSDHLISIGGRSLILDNNLYF